jgi:hypothetical protein
MARWILKHNIISTCILILLLLAQQVIIRYTSDMVDVLVSGVYVLGACAIGIYLCKYKLARIDKGCRY